VSAAVSRGRDSARRRVVDVVVAGGAGTVLSPVLGLIAVLVRLRMGPPVLFRQRRTGRDGREFAIVKFRTMRAPLHPSEPDAARVPPLGRMLRATSLDELPQLWNVLRGEMSLIGPRPTLPEQVAGYSTRQHRRHEIRPGLTGWAQVNGRNAISWPERIELDIWYSEHRSLRLDLAIVARTLAGWGRREGITGEGGVNPGFPGPSPSADADRDP